MVNTVSLNTLDPKIEPHKTKKRKRQRRRKTERETEREKKMRRKCKRDFFFQFVKNIITCVGPPVRRP